VGPGFSWVCLLFVGAPVVIVAGVLVFFVVCCVHCESRLSLACRARLGCVCGGWVGLVVCVTSCEGHMVDALASRADEGRRSLR
jgi:hypothetical protein